MKRYLLVDTLNTFFRARHAAPRRADMWTKVGFAIHTTLASINKSCQKEGIDHVIVCTEGRSWRKEIYAPYKRNRKETYEAKTDREREEDAEFMEAYQDMIAFFRENTNCTVLHNPIAEADDLIARWIKLHPEDHHTILSSDSDFIQLISDNVSIYNGMQSYVITPEGYHDDSGKPVKDKKTGMPKEVPDPQYALFEKCVRGDTADNIFSAYPGVRKKGSVNKVGLTEAFADRNSRGFVWNNFMLQRWTDHNGKEHRVLDDYERNVELIDLDAQPDDIKEFIDESITEQTQQKAVPHVGRHFLRFCGKYDLNKLSDFSKQYSTWMNSKYE